MVRKTKAVELYAIKPCKICGESIPPHSNKGKPYTKFLYENCNTCTSSWCRTEWRKQLKKGLTKTYSPPLELIDYFTLGMQAEYRQLLALEAKHPIQYNQEKANGN